ncbi:hypothetical protein JCM10914A_47970 [Paenibacillus sp. JCM 10914]
MKNYKSMYLIIALMLLLMSTACGTPTNTNTAANQEDSGIEADTPHEDQDSSPDPSEEILIVIDQTPKPIEGNSFDFVVKQLPTGYALAEITWKSDQREISNTVQQAIEHGQNGEDGFYISGNGQFSGFIYPDELKNEEGQVIFRFINEEDDQELTWEKSITLN